MILKTRSSLRISFAGGRIVSWLFYRFGTPRFHEIAGNDEEPEGVSPSVIVIVLVLELVWN
jgi:hypothetical protein